MSFSDPCDVSDDIIPDHAKIGTCDMLSVFTDIRLIQSRRLCLKPMKGPQIVFFVSTNKHSIGAVQWPSTIPTQMEPTHL